MLFAVSGCESGECGEGTVRHHDKCVLVDPFDKEPPVITVDPPTRTRRVGNVRLRTNESAQIYYTVDDSVVSLNSLNEPDEVVIPDLPDNAIIHFFAIDLSGNQSEERTMLWTIDRAGPGVATDITLTVNGTNRSMSWLPPIDNHYGGFILARVEGQLDVQPEPGKQYAVGDTISPGVTVVRVDGPEQGAQTTFEETHPTPPGLVRYLGWGFDDLYNYGSPSGAYTVIPMPAQLGAITASPAGNTVTVQTKPPNLTITGTTTYAAGTLQVKLQLRNDTTRVLFAPKLMVTNTLPAGVTFANSSGLFETKPYRAFGAAIPPGSMVSQTLTFTGFSAATALPLDIDVRDGYLLVGSTDDQDSGGYVLDPLTAVVVKRMSPSPLGPRGDGQALGGGITPDGRLVMGARTFGGVSSFDLATGSKLYTTQLREQKAHVRRVVLDGSGATGYAVVMSGHIETVNNSGGGAGARGDLVRFDTATMTENGRLDLGLTRTRDMALSPNGRTLLIASGVQAEGVAVIDLRTFQITKRLTVGFAPEVVLYSPSGQIVVVGTQVRIFDGTTGVEAMSYPIPGTRKVNRAAFMTPTKLWIGRRNELSELDLTSGVVTPIGTYGASILDIFDGKAYVGNGTVSRVDAAGVEELPYPTFNQLQGHYLGRTPF